MSAKKTTVIIAAVLAVLGGLYVLPLTFEDSPAPAVETAEQAKANEAIPDPELSVTETAGASAAGVETRMDPGSDSGASFRGDDASEEDSEAGPGTPEKAPKEKDALPPKGSISGRILSTRHEGLAGAEVQLIQRLASGGGPRAVTQSGEDGSYRFLDVKEAQTYVVRAAYEGYSTRDSRAVIMRADKTVTDVDIYLGGGFAVHGRVLDSKGNGVEGLLVQLLEGGQRAFNPIPNLNAVSGYDGAFVIANVGPGEYAPLVQTSKKNRADQSQVRGTDFTMPGNADLYDVDIVIGDQVEGFVSGRVTGTQGEPVYWVELVAFSGNLLGVAKSDEEGYYRIEGLGGAETVSMEVKGFASGYGRTKRQGVPVNSDNVDFVLKEAGAVSGRVVDAVTGEPLTEFAVQWRQYWPWQDFQLESGEFTLKQIEEEEVVLRVRAPGYATGKSDAITVPPGETVEDITIPLTRGNELAGVVVDAVSGQPIQGVRIKPFEGYRLRSEALRMGWGPQDPITDAQGRFRIGGMEPGTVVNLVASHEAYAPAVLLDLPTDSEDELVFALGRGSAVTGTVRRGPEPAGANIVFFRIDFRPEPADPFSFHAFCAVDSLGEFERRGLPPGRYVVMCFEETENGRTQEPAWQERREFFDGETYELSIQLEETGAIVGQVAGHQPGERIQIQVETPDWSGDPYMIAYTESDGSFVFEALPPGDYIIGVSDMPEFNREVTVAPGELVAVAIDLGTDSEV